MRINTIYISKYKNLNDFKLDFSESYYVSVLLGKNGTGKSNIFEFITIIFKCLDLAKGPADFKEKYITELALVDENCTDFEIEYTINDYNLLISLKENDLKIHSHTDTVNIPYSRFIRHKDKFLPDYIVGYYSGKSNRFESLFNKHIEEAEAQIVKVKRAYDKKDSLDLIASESGKEISEEEKVNIPIETFRRLFFAKHQYSQLLLLTLFAFRYGNKVIDNLLKNYLKIDKIENISVRLKSPRYNTELSFENSDITEFWGARGSGLKCASFLYRVSKRNMSFVDMDIESSIKEGRTFLIDTDRFFDEVVTEFENESETFRYLESLFLSDLFSEIVIDIKRDGTDDLISFSQLSEGEQQMISTLGLMIITGNKNSLYLLDEPDTHLNPKWQRDYISIIKELVGDKGNSHILISTHSPFIPQAVKDSDLILFKHIEGKTVTSKIDNMHTWRIDQILTSEIYELETTRSAEVEDSIVRRDELMSLTRKLSDAEELELKEIDDILEELGVGRTAEEVKINKRMKALADVFKKVDKA